MYSVRRMSTLGVSPNAPPSALQGVSGSPTSPNKSPGLAKLNTTFGSKGSIGSKNSLAVDLDPIPLSAHPDTPLVGMPSSVADAAEPRRDLVLNLIIVRHAETDLNARRPRVVQGQMDTALNAKGMKQALMLAHRLEKEKVDYVYSSDLIRAKQTAEEIARVHGKTVLIDPRLREQNLGDLTGQPWSAAKARLKAADMNYDQYLASHGGETAAALKERAVEFYIDVVEKHLLAPNRIALPRPAGSSGSPIGSRGNLLTEHYGPATPASATVTATPADTSASTKVTPAASHGKKRREPPRVATVVVVTHGGPIKHLLTHLVADLGFTFLPKVLAGNGRRCAKRPPKLRSRINPPVAPRMSQFPRPAGVFHVRLARRRSRAPGATSDETDWMGHVIKFNDTAHLSSLSEWAMHSTDVPPGAVQPTAAKAAAEAGKKVGPYRLVRIKKDKSAKKGNKGEREIGSGGVRALGAKMFGKFIGGGVIAGSGSGGSTDTAAQGLPQGSDKRKKSLGW